MPTTFIAVVVVSFASAPIPSTVSVPGLPSMAACATMLVTQATGFMAMGATVDSMSCTHGEIRDEGLLNEGGS